MLLYIVRHGHPDYATDSLTERGWLQAEAVGKRLAATGIDQVYSSPMGRAKQERYADYRARKLKDAKKHSFSHILVTGLIFLFIGIVLTVIWSELYY